MVRSTVGGDISNQCFRRRCVIGAGSENLDSSGVTTCCTTHAVRCTRDLSCESFAKEDGKVSRCRIRTPPSVFRAFPAFRGSKNESVCDGLPFEDLKGDLMRNHGGVGRYVQPPGRLRLLIQDAASQSSAPLATCTGVA